MNQEARHDAPTRVLLLDFVSIVLLAIVAGLASGIALGAVTLLVASHNPSTPGAERGAAPASEAAPPTRALPRGTQRNEPFPIPSERPADAVVQHAST